MTITSTLIHYKKLKTMQTIRQLAMQWWEHIYDASERFEWKFKMALKYKLEKNIYSLTDEEIENIFYNEVVVKWWDNLPTWGNPSKEYFMGLYFVEDTVTPERIKEIYLKEHSNTYTPANVFDELNDMMANEGIFSNNPLSVNKDVEVEHLEQPQILKDFIGAIKSEFKDENWEYLDFVADRVISQQPKEDTSWNKARNCYKKLTNRAILLDEEYALLDYLEQHYTLIKK